ncbi:hypothetical protein W59_31339 [Rhodococcus opacus RKJ300 = JCM 13270]|uniref:Uncharacterized protein n=1 Tax=Rhodococcus opacus RKJ300 = JCM 13270 TaxID=1165867 RepID=I0WD02_RHOOP|nr:hypothetical protein W59_31339 [Rhodococcus opacus RKJ300 = JCM 13270]
MTETKVAWVMVHAFGVPDVPLVNSRVAVSPSAVVASGPSASARSTSVQKDRSSASAATSPTTNTAGSSPWVACASARAGRYR